MELNPDFALGDTLKAAQTNKKAVTLHLSCGHKLSGNVGGVGTAFVLLSELVGKEFYDALVRLTDVSAVEIRAR